MEVISLTPIPDIDKGEAKESTKNKIVPAYKNEKKEKL